MLSFGHNMIIDKHVFMCLQVQYIVHIMVIWKEREHETVDFQTVSDLATIEALQNCELLKYFRVPGMKEYIRLLECIIDMWDPEQQHFVVGTHILTIDIEDIYFLIGLSRRGRPLVLSVPQGGESSLDDLIDQYCALGTYAQSRKLHIQQIVDRPLRMLVYTIGKVVGTRFSHLTTRSHML